MPDIFGKIMVVVLTVIALFIVPLVTMTQKHDSITQGVVYGDTVEFVDRVREQGQLTQEMYLEFVRALDATGVLYTIEMKHGHRSVVPVFGPDGVTGTETIEDVKYENQILETLYVTKTSSEDLEAGGTEGVYRMSKGDTFSVTVYNKEKTLGQKMLSAVFQQAQTGNSIYAVYGGIIRDENF